MGIKRTTDDIGSIKFGTVDIDRVIRDGNTIWTRALMSDSFNGPNAVGLTNWTNILNSGDGGGSPYLSSVINGNCRMNIPDGLIGLNTQFSHWRWAGSTSVTNGDDGYIETQIGNKGSSDDSALYTGVWRRAINTGTGSFASAVGMVFSPSGLLIVRRVSSTNTTMYNCGTFTDGDICRMVQTGNVHDVYKNGAPVGSWNDSGATAVKASTNRSMVVTTSGSKGFLGGRRYSASLNYVECR